MFIFGLRGARLERRGEPQRRSLRKNWSSSDLFAPSPCECTAWNQPRRPDMIEPASLRVACLSAEKSDMDDSSDRDTLPPSIDPQLDSGVVAPPTTFLGILGRLGPGLIIAGSIVGSGELIATTKTGGQPG